MTSYGGIIRIRLRVEGDSFLSACQHKLPCIYLMVLYIICFWKSIVRKKGNHYNFRPIVNSDRNDAIAYSPADDHGGIFPGELTCMSNGAAV